MLEIIISAAREGGKIVREYFGKDLDISVKSSRRDLVTTADLKSQEAIINFIKTALIKKGIKEEDIGFIAEEKDFKKSPQTPHIFIIDPLDGTSSYVQGLEFFCVSIAYIFAGEMKMGVIYNPMKDIIYFAEKGKGAFKVNGQRQKLAIEEKTMKNSYVAINTGPNPDLIVKMFQMAIDLTPHVFRVRQQAGLVFGFTALLENHYQVVINGNCKIWDIAAAKLLLCEAGGVICDWQGKEIELDLKNPEKPYQILAGRKNLLKSIIKYV